MIKPGDKVRLRDYPSWGTGVVRSKDPNYMSDKFIVDWPEHGELVTIDHGYRLLTEDEWPEPRSG